MKAATEKLQQDVYKMSEELYKNAGASEAAQSTEQQAGEEQGESNSRADDNVVDAEYTEVKEKK